MSYAVFFSPEAKADLLELYDYIAERSGEDRALWSESRDGFTNWNLFPNEAPGENPAR